MRWPWTREHPTEGAEALDRSVDHLDAALARWPEVHRLNSSLEEFGRINHFTDAMRRIYGGTL